MTTTCTTAELAKSNHTRRQFIRRTGSAALMVAAAGLCSRSRAASSDDTPEKGVVGSNIYGWTQYAQRDQKKLEVEEVIAALRDAGYDYLETFMNVTQPEENGRFADQLKAKGLQPVSLYVGARLHETGKADEVVAKLLAAAKVCRQAGFRVISCNADPIGREKTEEELKTQAAAFAALGRGLKAMGMSLGLHHHMPEMVNGAREFHHGFRNTEPDEVGFCYDVHW
ncbi:MAG TPA: TIM barrel protein, partial [Clostridia bacterium]|nr:TIM barrel protein [Clostridia bacterium]